MKIKNILQIFIFLQFLSVPFIATAQNHEHYNPDIVVDAVGNSYVTWLAENDGSTTSGRIMVQKFNAAGTRQWSSDLQVSSKSLTWSSGDWQPTPKIDTDGTYVYVIWNRRNTEVAMQKIDANGILQWTEEKVVSVNEPPESIGNDLAVSDDGFIYINFQRYGPFGWASFLQKIDSDGNPQFANDIASGQGSNQTRPQIAISGNDIIYTMNNSTNGGPWLRRMDSAGNTIWHSIDLDQTTSIAVDSSGNPVSSGRSGDQIIVKKYDQNGAQVGGDIIVSSGVDNPERVHHYIDENDNIYVTWIADVTNATNKVFAQKIDSNGVRQWANDVEISVGEFTHLPDPRIYADGQGGANVVWYHGASGGGGYTIFMNGADAAGNRKYALSVIVNADGPPGGGSNQPPVFTSSPVTVFYVDVQNFYQVTATDINNNTITYSVTQGPTGYGINPLTGLVSWNPSGASVGVHPITIQADDNRGGITEQSFDLMVIYSIAQMVSPTNGSQITGNSIDFQWTAGAGILEYWLYVSTTPSGNNVYTKSQGLNTSVTVPNIT
ncbi:MAG: hypothetical protein KC618_07120, partial [Candidatus Omnitrophica bacterium]|nr:hypothetical protein [Candidatus Omnitrophota bacterium]